MRKKATYGTERLLFNDCIFLLLLLLAFVPARLLPNSFGYTPLYMLLTLLLLSFLYTLHCRRKFGYKVTSPSQTYIRGMSAKVKLSVYSLTTFVFPHILVEFVAGDTVQKLDMAVPSQDAQIIETDARFSHIGVYELGLHAVWFYDLLGLFRLRVKCNVQKVVVNPRIYEINTFSLKSREGRSDTLLSDYSASFSTEDYNGVREYVPGDSLKNVHWKLTAHTGKYMSRQFEEPKQDGVSVYLDLNPPLEGGGQPGIYDCLVESALAAAYYGLRCGLENEIVFSQGGYSQAIPIRNGGDLMRAATHFTELSLAQTFPVEMIMKNRAGKSVEFSNRIVCTARLNAELIQYVAELSCLGVHVSLILAVAPHADDMIWRPMLRTLDELGLAYRVVANAQDLSLETARITV